jgi:hypothetical protein
MSIEKRKARRHQVNQGARIFLDNSMAAFCTLLDVSATGAQVRLNDVVEIAGDFTLVLARNGGVQRRCRLVWRRDDVIGVQFVKPSTVG